MDRNAEQRRLDEADFHIANAERNITDQRNQIEKLRSDGHDTKLAEETLKQFEATLAQMHEHRDQIIKTIADIDDGKI